MAGSGSPSSGREPLTHSNIRKAAGGRQHNGENTTTNRFKEAQAAKGIVLNRDCVYRTDGHSVVNQRPTLGELADSATDSDCGQLT